jgi:hypothetical protein
MALSVSAAGCLAQTGCVCCGVAARRNDTIFAVKAPPGTTLEVPEPEFQRMEDGKLAQRYRWVCCYGVLGGF